MSTKSRIGRVMLIAAACLFVFHTVDGAPFIKKRRTNTSTTDTGDPAISSHKFDILRSHYSSTSTEKQNLTNLNERKNSEISEHQFDNHNLSSKAQNLVGANKSNSSLLGPEIDTDEKAVNPEGDADAGDGNGAGDGLENGEVVETENNGAENRGVLKDILENKPQGHIESKDSFPSALKFVKEDDDHNQENRQHPDSLTKFSKRLASKTPLIPLKMDELQPPDHIEGVRMEHDGHLNRDYKKEILLGNHEEFEFESESKLVDRLKDIFKRADTNEDDHVDLDELKSWIMLNVQQHLDEAISDNKRIFVHLDTNQDEYVTWKEFYVHFLLAKGYSLEDAQRQTADYDMVSLDPEEKERIIRYRFRWAEADEEPQDNKLTFLEFMNFRHPEQSKTMLIRMVKDLIDNFDKNDDKILTEEEFAMMPPGEIEPNMGGDQEWLRDRRKEFHEVIDLNKDGIVDESELKVYVDPHNANLAKLEAQNLIHLADHNSDGRLSLEEVLENAELFLGSKVVDASRNFHDEF